VHVLSSRSQIFHSKLCRATQESPSIDWCVVCGATSSELLRIGVNGHFLSTNQSKSVPATSLHVSTYEGYSDVGMTTQAIFGTLELNCNRLQLGNGEIGNLIDDFDPLLCAPSPFRCACTLTRAGARDAQYGGEIRSACCPMERSCSRGGESGRSTVASS
jgi:hypothetical protein